MIARGEGEKDTQLDNQLDNVTTCACGSVNGTGLHLNHYTRGEMT